jgi:hypothetical protein
MSSTDIPTSDKGALKRTRSSSLPSPPGAHRTRSAGSAVSHVSFELSDDLGGTDGPGSFDWPDSEGLASPAVRAGPSLCNVTEMSRLAQVSRTTSAGSATSGRQCMCAIDVM